MRWNGRVKGGRQAPSGSYLMVVRAQDAAGNIGPRRVPPRRSAVRGHPGLASLRGRPCHPTRGPGRAARLVRRSIRTAAAIDGASGAWGGNRALARGSQPVSNAQGAGPVEACRSRNADGARGHGTATRLPLRCRGGGARGWSFLCNPTPPGRLATGWRLNGDGYPDLLPGGRRGDPSAPLRGRWPAAGIRRRPVGCAALPRSRAIPI